MANNGLITRKDIIEDQALTIGTDYAKNMQPAIDANKQLVASLKEMAPLINAFRKTDSQQAYIALKQQENITTLQAINANKLLEASESSLEKIKQAKLKTEKESSLLSSKIIDQETQTIKLMQQEEVLEAKRLATKKEETKLLKEIEVLESQKLNTKKNELVILQQEEKLKKEKLITIQSETKLIQQEQQIIKNSLDIKNKELSIVRQKEAATKRNTKLTVEETLRSQESRRETTLQAKANGALSSTYEKLNAQRTIAQKRLADLLSAEVKNNAEIRIAQREYDKLDARVKAVDAATKNYSKNIGNYSSAFEGLNGTLKSLISTFGLVTGFALFGTIVNDIFTTVKDFDKQLIAVGKTTNLSGEELKQFGREVVDLGDKLEGVSIDGLISSAEVAGQLGVTGTANILKFSEAIEKLKLTSNIISDEQVGQFAKFIEVSSDSFENADKLASVITRLGNEFATTEAEVLANSTEIQKGIAVYNTSAQGVLALGAATSTLGSEAESSRSAIQTTFGVINNAIATGAGLQNVLKLTNLTQKELSQQFNKDATGVFVKLVKGLNTAKKEGQNLSLVLNDLGITEKRAFTVVGSLAANYSILEGAMAKASEEYINNIALNKEVAAAAQSIDSILGDIKDKFKAYILATNDANSGTEIITRTLKFLRDNLKDVIDFTIKYGTILLTFLGVQKLVNFFTATYNALKVAGIAAQISFTTATGLGTAAMKAQALAAREATVAQKGLNLATKATPWGIILAGLAAVVVAYMIFNDELSRNEKLLLTINGNTKRLQDAEAASNKQSDGFRSERFKQIEDEIALRRAKGEDSAKLDAEEIERKKKILKDEIETYSQTKTAQENQTKTAIQQSEIRIAQLQKEGSILAKSGYRVSKQGRTGDEITDLILNEKEKLKISKSYLFENSKIKQEEENKLQKLLEDLEKNKSLKDAAFQKEEEAKAKAARLKALKDRYDAEKKAQDDLFKLNQFRLQVMIDMDDEILKNDKAFLDDRLAALGEYEQLSILKNRAIAENELRNLGKYNEQTGRLIRELSNKEIEILLNEGKIKKRLTSEQILILEKFRNEEKKIKENRGKEIQKIIDNEVSLVQKQVEENLKAQDTELSAALEAENIKFKAITSGQSNIKKATEEHEKEVLAIKENYAKKGLQTQIDAIQKLLYANDRLPKNEQISAEKRAQIENDLAKYKLQLSEIGLSDYISKSEKRVELEKDAKEKIKELATELKDTLVDLTNTIFDARIQNIDNEISASNDYYNEQIELAGNDERQKSLLEKERAKKEKELQKEKQKEIVKQAIFNKVIATAEIGLNLAKTITALNLAAAQLDAISFGIAGTPYRAIQIPLAIGLAAAQAAVVLATPIPKYKMGRKGGPSELAVTGDGGVPEVVSRPDGSGARMTPNKPTLTFLQKDDVVHKSVADYNEYMRRSVMKSFYKEKELATTFYMIGNNQNSNPELLNELRKNTEAIKKQKTNVQVTNKIDFGYENYRRSNINWRA